MASEVLGELPAMLVGAHAANAYMPPRHTGDVDVLVAHENYRKAEERLRESGWTRLRDLFFPNARLGLSGSAWHHEMSGQEIDVLTSAQPWVSNAFSEPPACDPNGARVLPLPYLVLMKLDSARTVDQGDLGRILGRLSDAKIEEIVAVIERNYDDSEAGEDVRQYARIGRWEYDSASPDPRED